MEIQKINNRVPLILLFLVILIAVLPADDLSKFHKTGSSTETVDHSSWTAWLGDNLYRDERDINLLAYGKVTAGGQKQLKEYIEYLETRTVTTLGRDEQFAFWINLYNALTVSLILEEGPVESIRDIKSGLFSSGPWDLEISEVEGVVLTLNDIEHEILRPFFQDPRIHFAVNCASVGCPDLQEEAFLAQSLETQLDHAARTYLSHPRGLEFKGGSLHLSSLFKWYKEDFGKTQKDRLLSLSQWVPSEDAQELKAYTGRLSYDYDWSLNGTF
ncbi:DUF547 domain-containing protein [Oceanispirochaeta crateris]|nr:DUF547 domain-containing protein [Oceanispirochaeta crateris]